VKTTLDLPEELVREMKIRAAREGRKLREIATEIFQRGLSAPEPKPKAATKGKQVKLPLLKGGTATRQFTPAELDEILLQQEVEWHHEAAGC
jgi:plasmid stability protein